MSARRRFPTPAPEPRSRTERPSTGLERPGFVQRHDLLVVIAALALLAAGGLAYRSATAPDTVELSREALRLQAPVGWLSDESASRPPSPLAARIDPPPAPPEPEDDGDDGGDDGEGDGEPKPPQPDQPPAPPPPPDDDLVLTSPLHPDLRLEVHITARPRYSNLRGALSFARHTRYGDLYWAAEGKRITIAGHDWLRTRFQSASRRDGRGSPRVTSAIEYSTVVGRRLYVVTLQGDEPLLARLDELVAPTLRVDTRDALAGMALADNTEYRSVAPGVRDAMPAAVMIMAVDGEGGDLVPVAGGSGTIVSADGSVLTNLHVIWDEERGRPHDLFVIGRYRSDRRDPDLVCAGRPGRSKWMRELDLALVKCDVDMSGRDLRPPRWPTVAVGRAEPLFRAERLWIIGYPDVGGGAIHVGSGQVSGWVSDDGGATVQFIRTDAAVTHGNSGGAAVDEDGRLIGIPTAYRELTAANGAARVRVGSIGLIRPIELAAPLLAAAGTDWEPRPGQNRVEPTGSDAPGPPDRGVIVHGTVVDAATGAPVPEATVVVLEPSAAIGDLDPARLEEQALTWGHTDPGGEFTLGRRLARGAVYPVAVLARGYRPLIAAGALAVDGTTPVLIDPWGPIQLERHY